ncbi:hypothetical protein DH2020_011384 [Rehmannia glutinosa]|uniref:Uncharacterized protein n=1 Tax=Rehmannia glutinosa TaxID=99300 RepID=A0ABR0XDD0_REHGL
MNPSAPSISTKNNVSLEDVRRSVTYHPTIWGDYFLAYTSEVTEISAAEVEELEKQKEIVRKLLTQTPNDSLQKMELVDAIERLGVGYHFVKEIDTSLRNIQDINYPKYNNKDSDDLYIVALRFRLLRQHGYYLPCADVFDKFIDQQGNFKESLANNVEGMLSLYEASHFGVDGEEILDKALAFSSSRLESLLHQMSKSLSTKVSEALKSPIHKSVTRLAARKFITMYQQDDSHNKMLLNFAKLDFNILQKIHQKELSDITRWWKALDFANKLPFARDRMVECYFWILALYFEPHLGIARRILTKVIAIASVFDDIYDIYGTLDDLQLFTNIIQSWDANALEGLPPYMRICYKALLEIYDEMENEMEKVGTPYCVQYAKKEMKKLVSAYMEEAKWFYNKYTPTMEEYMKVAVVSSGYVMLSTTSLVGMGDLVTKEDFDWFSREPLLVRASATIARLMDDMVGYGFETKLSAVQCYMNHYGASEMEAFAEFQEQVKKAWKDINQECLQKTTVSFPILMNVVNLARAINLLYMDEDGYTNPKAKVKDYIKCVLIEPVTI